LVGTTKYIDPVRFARGISAREDFDTLVKFGKASDMWSVGVIILTMIGQDTLKLLQSDDEANRQYGDIMVVRPRPQIIRNRVINYFKVIKDWVIEELLNPDPFRRANAGQLNAVIRTLKPRRLLLGVVGQPPQTPEEIRAAQQLEDLFNRGHDQQIDDTTTPEKRRLLEMAELA
jgi:serine/threonine protein kinase